MNAPICLPFWTWFAVGAAVFAGILMLWIFWSFIHDSLKWRAALRSQAKRDRIDNEAFDREKRFGDAADSGHLSPEEIDRRIAKELAALRARKAEKRSNLGAT